MKSFLQFLKHSYQYFLGTKRVWRKPPQADLLIIDRGTASPLDEMFAHHAPHALEIRGESINMRALLRAVPKIRLGALAYIEAYIDFVKPKLILSRTDNNATMWQLKRRPNVTYKIALIQNGMRTQRADSAVSISSKNDVQLKNVSDKYFVFGDSAAQIMQPLVNVDFLSTGNVSLNNRDFRSYEDRPNLDTRTLFDVALISTFRSKEPELNDSQRIICESLDNFLVTTKYELLIIGNGGSEIEQELETQFFADIFKKAKFRIGFFRVSGNSYQHLKTNRWILSFHSTLGFESLAIGVKVGFLYPASPVYDGRDLDATSNLGSSGLFWSRSDDPQEHNRVFTYLDTVSDEQWERDSGWIRDQLMVYDYGNTKIRAYVEGVLADKLKGTK